MGPLIVMEAIPGVDSVTVNIVTLAVAVVDRCVAFSKRLALHASSPINPTSAELSVIFIFSILLKLELLTQFPASNDESELH